MISRGTYPAVDSNPMTATSVIRSTNPIT